MLAARPPAGWRRRQLLQWNRQRRGARTGETRPSPRLDRAVQGWRVFSATLIYRFSRSETAQRQSLRWSRRSDGKFLPTNSTNPYIQGRHTVADVYGPCRKVEQKTVKQLTAVLRHDSRFVAVEPVSTAHRPIVRAVLAQGGIQCDISVGNDIAVHNSRLIRAYIDADPRVRPLAITLHAWAKARRVLGGSDGQLSSYALQLCLLTWLQMHRPAVLPCLQRPPPPVRCPVYVYAIGFLWNHSLFAASAPLTQPCMHRACLPRPP